jgi:AcrR family transcriptional regulator
MAYRRTPQIQARLDVQRAAIVRAAADLVAESGYAGASIARVAARAGVAPGTVYNHFAGKTELLAEVLRTVVGREVAAVRAAAASARTAADQVVAVIETFAGRAAKRPRLAHALLAEPVDPGVDRLRQRFREQFADVVAEAIAGGVRSGELPPQSPPVVAAALIGAFGQALVRPLAAGGEPTPDTLPTVITFALRGIGATDASHP